MIEVSSIRCLTVVDATRQLMKAHNKPGREVISWQIIPVHPQRPDHWRGAEEEYEVVVVWEVIKQEPLTKQEIEFTRMGMEG